MPTGEALVFIPSDIRSARSGAFRPAWQVESFNGETMGTSWQAMVSLPPPIDRASIESRLLQAFRTVVQQMSPWEPGSDLRRFQAAPSGTWVPFHPESFAVLARALQIAEQTDGLYDPTFANAIDLLGFGPSSPSGYSYQSPAVRQAFAAAGHRALRLDPANRRVLQPGGLGLDLCSIAKGYAVDLAAQALEQLGIQNYLVEIGGEARGLGCKPDGQPWLYAIERPSQIRQLLPPLHLALCGISLATSGNYLRHLGPIGHIVHPSQEQPHEPLLSVSVIADNCADADAYATALYLLGPTRGLAFATTHHIPAIFQTPTQDLLSPPATQMLL